MNGKRGSGGFIYLQILRRFINAVICFDQRRHNCAPHPEIDFFQRAKALLHRKFAKFSESLGMLVCDLSTFAVLLARGEAIS